MDNILKTLINIYNMNEIDWLGYKLQDRYSYHHIIKKCDGGKRTLDNGAVLFQTSHSYLHTIENYDIEKYILLNKILKDINTQRYMSTEEQLRQINFILSQFENEYEGYISSRDKKIIKDEYKERVLWKKKV